VQLSTRGRYAVMAMVHIAGCCPGGGDCRAVPLGEIAAAQALSLAYLEQLFAPLRRAGLVTAARGPGGGYRLARPATEISIGAVLSAADEKLRATRCVDGVGCLQHPGCDAGPCQTHELWAELDRQIELFCAGVTLADVVAGKVEGRATAPAVMAPAGPALVP
jgi:Rrf2 family iron-sulfur cluster assembly transcriptional regulator